MSSVGSKAFTESVILGEMVGRAGARRRRRPSSTAAQLGGTEVVLRALETGAVDVYPEYTGTLTREILRDEAAGRSHAGRSPTCWPAHGSAHDRPLGFDNSYALAMTEARARRAGHPPHLRPARAPRAAVRCSRNEFMNRGDGWPGLRAALRPAPARRAAWTTTSPTARSPAAAPTSTDVYTHRRRDPRLRRCACSTTIASFFPRYDAVLLYRADLRDARARRRRGARAPARAASTTPTMIALNARAKLDRVPESEVAADFLAAHVGGAASRRARERVLAPSPAAPPSTWRWSALSLLAAIAARRPARHRRRAPAAPRPRRRSAPPACCRPSRRWRCWCC